MLEHLNVGHTHMQQTKMTKSLHSWYKCLVSECFVHAGTNAGHCWLTVECLHSCCCHNVNALGGCSYFWTWNEDYLWKTSEQVKTVLVIVRPKLVLQHSLPARAKHLWKVVNLLMCCRLLSAFHGQNDFWLDSLQFLACGVLNKTQPGKKTTTKVANLTPSEAVNIVGKENCRCSPPWTVIIDEKSPFSSFWNCGVANIYMACNCVCHFDKLEWNIFFKAPTRLLWWLRSACMCFQLFVFPDWMMWTWRDKTIEAVETRKSFWFFKQ